MPSTGSAAEASGTVKAAAVVCRNARRDASDIAGTSLLSIRRANGLPQAALLQVLDQGCWIVRDDRVHLGVNQHIPIFRGVRGPWHYLQLRRVRRRDLLWSYQRILGGDDLR